MSPTKKFLEESLDIANQFGFRPLETLFDLPQIRKVRRSAWVGAYEKKDPVVSGLISILQAAYNRDLHNSGMPFLLVYSTTDESSRKTLFSHEQKELPVQLSLTILNIHDGFAEAVALTCMNRILSNAGDGNRVVQINSIGDSISCERFKKAVQKAFTHHQKDIPSKYKDLAKDDLFAFCREAMRDRECEFLKQVFPRPMNYLTLAGREHFEDVLDYVESQGLSIEINPFCVRDSCIYSHTIINLENADNKNADVVAEGGRFNNLSESVLHTSLPVVNMTITFNRTTKEKDIIIPKRKKKTQWYFIHTGQESRKKALQVLDLLCERRVYIEHRLHLKTVSEQLDAGDGRAFEYLLIVGHQEVIDGMATLKIRKYSTLEKVVFSKIHQRLRRIR